MFNFACLMNNAYRDNENKRLEMYDKLIEKCPNTKYQ